MENIKQKRIYSIIVDMIISNFIGVTILSLFNLEKNMQLGKFTLLDQEIGYGYSFQAIIILLYFVLFDVFNKGKSFGKLIFSIFVVGNSTLRELSFITRFKRTILKVLGIIIFPISLIMFLAFDTTIHDSVAKTKTIVDKKT